MKTLILILCLSVLYSCNPGSTTIVGGSIQTETEKKYSLCVNSSPDSTSSTYSFQGNSYTLEVVYHTGLDCVAGTGYQRDFFTGKYTYSFLTEEFAYRDDKLEVSYLTNSKVFDANTNAQCGFVNWTINTPKDITDNNTCNGGTIYSNDPAIVMPNAVLNDSVFDDGSGTYQRIN